MTSRSKSYAATPEAHLPADEDWIVRTLQPFAFGQVQSFVTSWYQGIAQATDILTATEAYHQSEHLLAALRATPAVHPLVTSPLLLTMLTILHYNTNDITRDRAHLYHECVELLLERWEAVRHYDATTHPDQVRRPGPIPGLDLSLLQGMVHDLAFCAHDQPPQDDGRGLIARALLEGKLLHFFRRLHDPQPGRQVQRLCQVLEADAGLLQATDQEQYTLPHLTFQEYLAACYLVDQAGEPQQDLLTLAYDRWRGPYAEHWREALLLLIGRLRQQGPHALVRDGLPWLHLLLARRYRHAVKSVHQWQRDVLLATLSYAETGGGDGPGSQRG